MPGYPVPGLDSEFPLFIQDPENPGNREKFKKILDIPSPLLYNIIVVWNNYSSIAQSVEHAAVNRAVVGSSPTRGVFLYIYLFARPHGQAVKTSPFHGGNRGPNPLGVIE